MYMSESQLLYLFILTIKYHSKFSYTSWCQSCVKRIDSTYGFINRLHDARCVYIYIKEFKENVCIYIR